MKAKSRYSFEDRGTDRQTESISECILKDFSNDIWHAYQNRKLVGDEENNIPPPLGIKSMDQIFHQISCFRLTSYGLASVKKKIKKKSCN